MADRLINSRFAGKCRVCRKPYAENEQVYYGAHHVRGAKCAHPACYEDYNKAPQAPEGPVVQPWVPPAQPKAPHAARVRQEHASDSDLQARFPGYKQVHAYADVEALLAATEQPRNPCDSWRDWRENDHGATWYGMGPEDAGTFDKVAKIVREGWTRGADRIAAALDGFTVNAQPRSIRRVRVRRDFGAEVDITEYWRGRADIAWTACTRAARPARTHYTIVNDAINMGGADADTLFWRGAACVALADKLTAAGYSVKVVSAWHAADNGGLVCYVTAKPFDAPMDIPTLAAAVANPAFFRCIGHAWGNGTESESQRHGAHGYSVPAWPAHPGEILASNAGQWNEKIAREWVAEQIALIEVAETRIAA